MEGIVKWALDRQADHDRRTNYQRGADFERKARDDLIEKKGALLVVRAAGSHGVADLVAFFAPDEVSPGDTHGTRTVSVPNAWLVQVKKDGKIPLDEREALIETARATGTVPVIAWHDIGIGVTFIHAETKEEM